MVMFAGSGWILGAPQGADGDLLIDGFEEGAYRGWTLTGDAFGEQPASGTLPNQMQVSGFRGRGLVNTYHQGDGTTGEATSAPFIIQRSHLAFLIGGGADSKTVGMELRIDDQPVRSATGRESEELSWVSWDVRALVGQSAQLRIFDRATGSWGHLLIDHIHQTDQPLSGFDWEYQRSQYQQSASYMNEPLRPQVHFSPEIHWMNDPNGLVYHDGEYHLFYQYNPAGNAWGHMSWGHAVSPDLMHWKHLPVAIPEKDGVMAFSGCCVVDHKNTSGFGEEGKPAMVAVYTGHGHGKQAQHLAYSNDNGRSWQTYANNPVLDIGSSEFRDPKVFWHEPTQRWVMVVALAVEKVIAFYASSDLKRWEELSRFGPAGATNKPNWECPDLFELPIEGEEGKTMWVLEADMGSGSIAGGSGGEYFVGDFDGTRFTSRQDARWVDYGRDFYAPVSWSNIPESDGRRIWLGWLNNWETCLGPTHPWRSCMSIPRSLSLRKLPGAAGEASGAWTLVQRPVQEWRSLIVKSVPLNAQKAAWPPAAITEPGEIPDRTFLIDMALQPGTARSCGLRIRTGTNEYTEVGYDQAHQAVYVDRRNSGNVDFHPAFAGRHEAPTRQIDGGISLQILVDRSSIEVFINEGEGVITDCIFPTGEETVLEAFAGDRSAAISGNLHTLRSIWRP